MKTACFCLVVVSICAGFAIADPKIYIKQYTYDASEVDSKITCRAIALQQLKRSLIEEIGTYIKSYSEVRNAQLTDDQIKVFSVGIAKTEVLNERWNGRVYWVKAKVVVDPDQIESLLQKYLDDKYTLAEFEGSIDHIDKLLVQNYEIKRKLSHNKKNETLANSYLENNDKILSLYYYDQGVQNMDVGEIDKALDDFSKSIDLDDAFISPFIKRYQIYKDQKQTALAIRDLNSIIDIDPNFVLARYIRGHDYFTSVQYDDALIDFERVASIDGTYKNVYWYIGYIYLYNSNYRKAIDNFTKQINIDPKSASSYSFRGTANFMLGSRGQAIADFNRAIQLDPNDGQTYFNRGKTYAEMGEGEKCFQDMKIAARLGYKDAQRILRENGVGW